MNRQVINMKKTKNGSKNGWKTLAIIELIILILVTLLGIYGHVLRNIPVFQFAARVLDPKAGGKSILNERKETEKPYPLTNKQKYPKTLVNENSINVLLIGPDVSGANYDSLMIVSIDEKSNEVKLINLPRDIYIDYSKELKNELKKAWSSYNKSKGIYKINAAHTIGKKLEYKKDSGRFGNPEYDFTADLIEEVFGIYIDDFVYVKPSSFRRIVDYFGGVEIDVPYLMKYSDPTQDLKINIKKGLQTLNGAQAEGFVRFRQGVDEKGKSVSIGDIERKKNQVTFVKAFMDQHLTLKNIGKFITIFNDMHEYVTTSLTAEKAGDYGKIAERMYKNKFTQTSEEIECVDVKIDGVYYLKFSDAK